MSHVIHLGDCLDVVRAMPDASIDAVVTDPPYGLGKAPDALAMLRDWLDTGHHDVKGRGFMGREWDAFVPQPVLWREVYRVMKPGAHLVAFAGTRTQDLMGLALRLAGFEIRDCLSWLYGTGFPKSLDISKAIDKAAGAAREVIGPGQHAGRESRKDFGVINDDSWQAGAPRVETAPATDAARQWEGFGTALKPAYEPIILARKPLIETVAANVQAHGTGGINIDACRIEGESTVRVNAAEMGYGGRNTSTNYRTGSDLGRWPANVVLDEVAAELLDRQTGDLGFSAGTEVAGNAHPNGIYGARVKSGVGAIGFGDRGGASRFFYTAKASSAERELEDGSRSTHPTVKPTDLMRWLVRLVTPPGGVVLDPFMGSGSTGVACAEEGFRFIGIEREPEYHAIAVKRLDAATRQGRLDL